MKKPWWGGASTYPRQLLWALLGPVFSWGMGQGWGAHSGQAESAFIRQKRGIHFVPCLHSMWLSGGFGPLLPPLASPPSPCPFPAQVSSASLPSWWSW